jgi:hypothetical protein
MSLPENIKGLSSVMGRSSTNILLASISTALHLDKAPVIGQVPGTLTVQSIIVGQEDGPYRYRTEIGTGLKRT